MISLRDLVPPIALPLARRAKQLLSPSPVREPELFDGNGDLFKSAIINASVYFEYGMGLSTLWALQHTAAQVWAVDTSDEWVSKVRGQAEGIDPVRLHAQWIDLGPVEDWGYPSSYMHRARFEDYVNAVWASGASPDLVLIDGRFRVCSFLHSLLLSKPGTKIIFDDYASRGHYHIVEEFVRPSEECGRQRLFVVPSAIDRSGIASAKEKFLYVMD